MNKEKFLQRVEAQLQKAYDKHGKDQWGRHEFYGIIKEEFDEMWDEIKADGSDDTLLDEIEQIVCVCLRYIETGDRYRGNHERYK